MNVKALREQAGMSQEDLAKKMGLDRSTVAKWETGISKPTAGKFPALAAALGCSIDALFAEPENQARESAGVAGS